MSNKRQSSQRDDLLAMLSRSEELQAVLCRKLPQAGFDESIRGIAVYGMCMTSLEHAAGLRIQVGNGCITSAISLMRLQYEAR